jgi:DDE superfamily endonuclease
VLLAEDETDLLLFPPLRSGWAERGQPAPVPLSGVNAKRVIFGTLNLETGHRLFLERPRPRGIDCRIFLYQVSYQYRGWRVALLWDEHSCHTDGRTQAMAASLGMELLWLPKRSPHLNPMDHLWRHGKEVICANHQYETIAEQVDRFIRYLSGLSAQDALRKAGVLSDNFWVNL